MARFRLQPRVDQKIREMRRPPRPLFPLSLQFIPRVERVLLNLHNKARPPRARRPQLHPGMVEYVGDVAVLMDRRPVPGASRRRIVVVVVVVDVIGGLSHARRGGHHRDGLVIPELAAAPTALENGDEATSVLLIEEGVEDRIYAGIASAQPLGDRRGDRQDLVFPLYDVATQLDHGEDHVERQPRENEEYDDHDQHLDYLHLRLLL